MSRKKTLMADILKISGISQSEMARLLGWSRQRVQAIAEGRNGLQSKYISKVIEVSGIEREKACKILEKHLLPSKLRGLDI